MGSDFFFVVCSSIEPSATSILSLHDALPILDGRAQVGAVVARLEQVEADRAAGIRGGQGEAGVVGQRVADLARAVDHTSELQSRVEVVYGVLVEKSNVGRCVVGVDGVLGQTV